MPPDPLRHALRLHARCLTATGRLLAFGLLLPVLAAAQAPPPRTLAEIRNAASRGQSLPFVVTIRATITHVDDTGHLVFVDDGTAGMALVPAGAVELAPGQIVEAEGRLLIGARGPSVVVSDLRLAGTRAVPPPLPLTWPELRTGRLDARMVAVRGVVRRVEPRGVTTRVRLMTEGGAIHVDLTGSAALEVDAIIDLHGVVVPPEGDPLSDRRLVLAFASTVSQADRAVPAEQVPMLRIADLPQDSRRGTLARRIRLSGVVTRQRPGRSIYLRDETGSAYIETDEDAPLLVGDRVEAMGYTWTRSIGCSRKARPRCLMPSAPRSSRADLASCRSTRGHGS